MIFKTKYKSNDYIIVIKGGLLCLYEIKIVLR